jgi:hypothetical protein
MLKSKNRKKLIIDEEWTISVAEGLREGDFDRCEYCRKKFWFGIRLGGRFIILYRCLRIFKLPLWWHGS